MAELIERQNTYLHGTVATSVVEMGTGDKDFTSEIDGEQCADGNIRDWAMEAKTAEDTFLFQSVEPGRRGQCYFLHQKNRQEEAEKWLDDCFNGLLQKYRAARCKTILGGEGHVRREKQVRMTTKILLISRASSSRTR